MLANPPVPVQSKYSLEEIDNQLETLSNLLRFSLKASQEALMKDADKWLDRRNRLTGQVAND